MQISYFKNILIIIMLLKTYLCNSRQKRLLLFPDNTPSRAQFIFGIGIPLDLDTESLTSGYVVKLEYYVPTNASIFRQTQITPQLVGVSKREVIGSSAAIDMEYSLQLSRKINSKYKSKKLLNYRWAIYKGLEKIIERMGHPGHPCLLRSICEAADTSFHYHAGLLGELMHIIMTPSTSIDDMSHNPSNKYFYAEQMGKSGAPCDRVFKDCTESVLDRFSKIFLK